MDVKWVFDPESGELLPDSGLSPVVMEHANSPRNYGPLESFNGHARITGPCGDTMEYWLQVADGRIDRIGFTTTGCGTSRAAGSMATELALEKTLGEAAKVEQADILTALGGLPKESEHCALLASNTLKAAIRDYQTKPAPECGQCSKSECPSKNRRPEESKEQFQERQDLERRMCQIGMKLLVMSGKGGVGKSTYGQVRRPARRGYSWSQHPKTHGPGENSAGHQWSGNRADRNRQPQGHVDRIPVGKRHGRCDLAGTDEIWRYPTISQGR